MKWTEASAEISFREVEKLIVYLVREFVRERGGDFEELHSFAIYRYFFAYITYKPERNRKFPSWVTFCIKNDLRDYVRKRVIKQKGHQQTEADLTVIPEPPKFSVFRFLEGLSRDAAFVAKLALEPPPDIRLQLYSLRSKSPKFHKNAIVEFLSNLGWGEDRIDGTFAEVAGALNGI